MLLSVDDVDVWERKRKDLCSWTREEKKSWPEEHRAWRTFAPSTFNIDQLVQSRTSAPVLQRQDKTRLIHHSLSHTSSKMAPKKAAPRVQENVQLGPQVREGQ